MQFFIADMPLFGRINSFSVRRVGNMRGGGQGGSKELLICCQISGHKTISETLIEIETIRIGTPHL